MNPAHENSSASLPWQLRLLLAVLGAGVLGLTAKLFGLF
jgi:hypothetical protein